MENRVLQAESASSKFYRATAAVKGEVFFQEEGSNTHVLAARITLVLSQSTRSLTKLSPFGKDPAFICRARHLCGRFAMGNNLHLCVSIGEWGGEGIDAS